MLPASFRAGMITVSFGTFKLHDLIRLEFHPVVKTGVYEQPPLQEEFPFLVAVETGKIRHPHRTRGEGKLYSSLQPLPVQLFLPRLRACSYELPARGVVRVFSYRSDNTHRHHKDQERHPRHQTTHRRLEKGKS